MADKNWWDSHKEKDTNVGNWWDKYNTEEVEAVGKKITDSVNSWMKSHQNYVANYQNRTKNRKYDYSDDYVKDPNDWLMKVSEQKKAFDASADSILAYMDRYKGYLDAEWMKSVQDALSGARAQQDIVVGNASADSKWWSNFANEDEYKTAQRYDGYNKKYSGMSQEDLATALGNLQDGEEKNWLDSYQWRRLMSNEDFAKYQQAGASIKNPSFEDAEKGGRILWWEWDGEDIGNIVTYSRENADYLAAAAANEGVKTAGNYVYRSMNEDEVKVYNYILAKYGKEKGDEFLSYIMDDLNAREGGALAERLKSIDIPVVEELAIGTHGLFAGMDQWASGVRQNFTNEVAQPSIIQYSNAALADSMSGLGKYAYQATNVVGNMLPSIAISKGLGALGAGVKAAKLAGAATMSVGAAGNAYADGVKEYGMEPWQARIYGTLVGASEGALEYAIGGIPALRGAEDFVGAKIGLIDNALLRVGSKIGWSVVQEIGEEELQNYLEPAFRAIFTHEYDAPTIDELIETAIVTAISTPFMSGGEIVMNDIHGAKNAVKQYGEFTDDLINEGLESDQNSESYRLAQKFQQQVHGYTDNNGKQVEGKALSGNQIRNLVKANDEQIFKETRNQAKDRLTELGENASEVWPIAELVAKKVTGQELTRAEKRKLVNSFGSQVANEITNPTVETQSGTRAYNATYKSITERTGEKRQYNVAEDGKAKVQESGNAFDLSKAAVTDIVRDKRTGKVTDVTFMADGKEVQASGIQFADESQSFLVEAVSNMENITPKDATALIHDVVDTSKPLGEQLNGIDQAFNYGFWDYSVNDLQAGEFVGSLSTQQMMSAYELGKAARRDSNLAKDAPVVKMRTALEAQMSAEQKAAQQKANFESDDVQVYFLDKKSGAATKFDGNIDKYEGNKAATIRATQILSKMRIGGSGYYLYESYVGEDGVRYYKDENGVEKKAPHGLYREADGRIYIDLNAGEHGQGVGLFTLSHELTHFVKHRSEAQFKKLGDLVTEAYGKTDKSMDQRVLEKQAELKEVRGGKDVSYTEAYEEVLCDAMSTMISDGNFFEKVAEIKVKDKGLFNTMKRFFQEMFAKFKRVYEKLTPDQQDAIDIREMKDMFDRIQTAFAEAVVEASDNFQAQQEMGAEMSNEEAFMDSETAIHNQIRPPYSDGSKAFNQFVDELNPEARKTFDLFYGFYQKSRITNTLSVSGKKVKAVNISSLYLLADEWNDMLSREQKWADAAKALADFLPENVRKRMNMNEDGSLNPTMLEKEFKMPSSMAQRLVDALAYEKIDATYQLGNKTITLPTVESRQSVGGEAYRRAIIDETRKLFAEGKLKKVGIGTMSKDRWGSLGFLAANGKTGASGDFTTVCPQMMFNRGCWYCYRRAAMEKGVNNKLVANSVWYTGEILRIKDGDIEALNRNGGLRIQSFGDWMPHFSAMLADVLYDAELRGLQVKIITKEPSMINYIAALREQGIGKNLYFNLSADYTIERGPARQAKSPDSLDTVNPERPYLRNTDNGFWWKRAMTVEEANKYRQKYPWVNTRIVATTMDEFIRGLQDSRVDVVTGYHGNIRNWERIDSTTGEHKVEVEALGDAGMPRFAFNPATGKWVTEYEGKTQTHKRLAQEIAENNLQMEYYTKTCCITGRCATCEGKCGALARDFNVKNATNRDSESIAYWQKQMQYAIEPEFGDMTVDEDVKYSDRISDRDSKGNQLSKEQQAYFADSVVRDADGRLMVMYHGTANGGAFTVFDGDQLGNEARTSQVGQGFYFTNAKAEAESYTTNVDIYGRSSKGKNPYLHQVYLNITNPFDVAKDTLDLDDVKAVYGDGTYDYFFTNWIPFYLNRKSVNGEVLTKAAVQAMSKEEKVSLYVDYLAQLGTKELLSNMVRAFPYGKQSELLAAMQNRLGYDGIVEEYAPGKYQYVAFSSEQIKFVDNKNPTSDPDIRYSERVTTKDSTGKELTEAQQEFFADSKVRDKDGNLLVMYHGSSSSEKFTVFESRPMVNGKIYGDGYYFTEMKNEAQNWGGGQLYKVYVDLKNPYYVSDQGEVPEGIVAAARENSGRTYDKLSQDPNWWGSKMSREEYIDSNSRMWRNPDIALISAVDESGIPDGNEAEYYGEIARRKTELLKSLGYDGVIVATNRAKRNFREVVAFDSEQIKLTTNKKPTADKDIRYSERVSNKELAANDDTALYIKNTDKADYIGMIFNGAKTEETRSRRTLDAFIGKDFYVTDGKYVYGSIVLGEPHQYTEAEFHQKKNQLKHRVPVGDEYDIKPGGTKWAYPIESYKKFDKPKKLSDSKEYKNSFQARQVKFADGDTSNRDRDYLAAVKNGDMETAQRMVDEAAKEAGYPVKAYHGTPSFGFTVFDPKMSDDKTTLFFTDNQSVASTYAGRDVYRTKDIKDAQSFAYEKGKVYTEEELQEAHDFIQRHYHVYGQTKINVEKQTVTHAGTRYSAKQLMEMADSIAKKGIYGLYLNTDNVLEVDAGYTGWANIKNPEVNEWRYRIKYLGEGDFNYFKAKADDPFRLELLKNGEVVHNGTTTFSEMYSMLRNAIGGIRVEMAIRHATDGSDIGSSRFDTNYSDKNGNYTSPVMNTRELAKYAKKKGYSGVAVKNLYDWGNKNPPVTARFSMNRDGAATIYILFDSNQVKSADPVTYDADGKVIPLSQRFNEENDDIRYSERTNAPVFYSKMAKVIEGMKQEKFGASSVISMLTGRGVKAEEIRWSGIQAWLEGKKSVTKAELLEFINGSMLQIEEQDYSNTIMYTEEEKIQRDMLSEVRDDLWDSVDQYWMGLYGEWMPYDIYSADNGTNIIRDKVAQSGDSESESGKMLLQLANEIDQNRKDISALEDESRKRNKLHRWKEYALDGGDNYREFLFKLPGAKYTNDAMRTHWGRAAKGILAHARVQDFDTEGGKMLFVEEIQSDWHNEGHKTGYVDESKRLTVANTEMRHEGGWYNLYHNGKALHQGVTEIFLKQRFTNGITESEIHKGLVDEYNHVAVERKNGVDLVPDAPFKNNYHEYVLKRLIRMAAEEGYDSIGWTTADIQSDRWSDEYAEGYRIEYDQDIPKFLKKYGKQWGAEVGRTDIASNALGDRERTLKTNELENTRRELERAKRELARQHDSYERAFTQRSIDSMEKTIARLEQELSASVSVWSMNITDAMKKSVLEEGQELYSERLGHSVSNRALLANAFEGLSQNSNEYKLIQQYKGHIAELNSLEDKLSEFRHEIRKLRFGKDEERDAQKLARLESEAKEIAEAINKHDKKILSLEASEPLRKIIEHERKKESEKTRAHVKEIQQNKKVRAEQAELRHKIRKTIRDLDKILKHGNKQKNVKEDLQGVVTKALKAADILFTDSYSTYDMLRNGLGVDLSDSEEALVKTCTQMLKDIDKMPTDGYDNWQARQEAESKLSTKMSKLKDVFARERKRLNNTTVSSILGELADAYKSLEESEQSYVKGAYMEPVYEFLKNLQSEVGGAIVQDMTKAQLESVYAAYKMVLTMVRKANELFNNGIKMSREQLGNAVIEEVMKAGGTHGLWTKGEIARSRASWNNMKPVWVANRIGSESFGKLMQGLFEGQYNFAVDIDEAKRFKLDMDKKYKPRSWDKDKLYEFESTTGRKFSLNLQQIMSLYAFSKREQAYSHLLSGGFVYEANSTVVVDKNGIKRTYLHDGATSYKLNEATLNEIIGTLTAEQKAYVDEMQAYLSDVMGAKGNEVSMKLYGIQLFKEKFYFPLRSSGAYMERAKEAEMKKQQGQINLVNSGFTHAVKPQAKNPIILSGFMDVWAEHCNEMSMYHSMVLPMEDFRKVYNYSTVHDESYDSASVYQSIQDAYGKAATDYIDQLYRELNAGATVDPRETPFKAFISKFKKAAVMMSASVVVQQFSAVGRAYAIIDPKYFIGAKVDSETKLSAADEMKKYAPVAIIKEMGGFDTGTKGSAKSYILAEAYGKGERLKGLKTDEQYRSDLMGFMPAKADEITWCAIWEAVKRETKAKHKNMDVKSEEFLKLAGERFSEVIEKTQVYDSVLARSANMRSKGAFMNMATAFMAEPTTTINLLEDALRGRSAKKIARAFGAVAVSIVLNNALASVVYAMRDDDEDETLLEKYFQSFTSGMIDDLNPMSYYPFYKDVYSLFQGYDVERADMSVIADLRDALKKAVSVMGKDTDSMNEEQLAEHYKSVNEILLNLLDAGCSAFGVPMKNVRRDVNGMINAYTTISKDVTERDNSWLSFWDKVGSAAKDTIPVLAWTKDTAKADKLYDAIISGDKEYLARMKSGYKDESAYHSAVRKALRENDPRIQEAANAKYNGNTNEYKRIFKEIQNEGKFSFDDIMSAINTELSKLSPDKATSNYSASGYVEAIALGNTSNAQVMKDDIIATKMANGQTEAEAEKAFASDVATGIKNAYSAGLLTEARAEEMLVEYAGKDEEDAASKVSYWAFIEKNPKYKDILTEGNVEDFHEFAEPAGISLDVYAQFVTGTKGLATIYDDWGDELKSKREQVLEVIDSLPLTWQQKDALYLAAGYSENKIMDVPW